jgi:hypothetical protein
MKWWRGRPCPRIDRAGAQARPTIAKERYPSPTPTNHVSSFRVGARRDAPANRVACRGTDPSRIALSLIPLPCRRSVHNSPDDTFVILNEVRAVKNPGRMPKPTPEAGFLRFAQNNRREKIRRLCAAPRLGWVRPPQKPFQTGRSPHPYLPDGKPETRKGFRKRISVSDRAATKIAT